MDQLRRIGDRLDVIETALSVALEEPEPEHRGRLLEAISAATEVVRAEHDVEEKRSSLCLIHGSGSCRPARETPAAGAASGRWTDRGQDHAVRSAG